MSSSRISPLIHFVPTHVRWLERHVPERGRPNSRLAAAQRAVSSRSFRYSSYALLYSMTGANLYETPRGEVRAFVMGRVEKPQEPAPPLPAPAKRPSSAGRARAQILEASPGAFRLAAASCRGQRQVGDATDLGNQCLVVT